MCHWQRRPDGRGEQGSSQPCFANDLGHGAGPDHEEDRIFRQAPAFDQQDGELRVENPRQAAIEVQPWQEAQDRSADRRTADQQHHKVSAPRHPENRLHQAAQDQKGRQVPPKMLAVRMDQMSRDQAPYLSIEDRRPVEHPKNRGRPRDLMKSHDHQRKDEGRPWRPSAAMDQGKGNAGNHAYPVPPLRRSPTKRAPPAASATRNPTRPEEPLPVLPPEPLLRA